MSNIRTFVERRRFRGRETIEPLSEDDLRLVQGLYERHTIEPSAAPVTVPPEPEASWGVAFCWGIVLGAVIGMAIHHWWMHGCGPVADIAEHLEGRGK